MGEKGDAIYVPADGIHAYLSGDIVECMARSDNVLNTGFCPRADRDSIELFTAALTFSPRSADEETVEALKGPAILIVTGGKGVLKAEGKETEVKEGYVFFVGYNRRSSL